MGPSLPVLSLVSWQLRLQPQVSQHQMSTSFCLQGCWYPGLPSTPGCPQDPPSGAPPPQTRVPAAPVPTGRLSPAPALPSTFHPAARMILKHKCGHITPLPKSLCSSPAPASDRDPLRSLLTAALPALQPHPFPSLPLLAPLGLLRPPQVPLAASLGGLPWLSVLAHQRKRSLQHDEHQPQNGTP